jgi:hypothetical protein
MRFLPSNRSDWLGFLSRPFQAYIVLAVFFFFNWFDQLQSATWQVGHIMRDDGLAFFSGGYFISSFALSIIAAIQAYSAERRAAFRNAALAVVALVTAFTLMPPSVH